MTDLRLRQISLRWQICILCATAILISLVAMGVLAFRNSGQLVTELTLEKMMAQTDTMTTRIEDRVRRTRADTLSIPTFPPIPGIVRCWENEEEPGQDPLQTGSNTQIWIDRLAVIVSAQMALYPERIQCSVYDHRGAGVMRVESRGSMSPLLIEGIPNISAQPHFLETLKLSRNQVYVSPMARDAQGTAIVRFCTPFFGDPNAATAGRSGVNGLDGDAVDGGVASRGAPDLGSPDPPQLRGIFELVVDGDQMLGDAVTLVSRHDRRDGNRRDFLIEVGDESMQLLFASEQSEAIPFSEDRFDRLRPLRGERLLQTKSSGSYQQELDTYAGYIAASQREDAMAMVGTYHRIYYNEPEDLSRYWFVAVSEYENTALLPVQRLGQSFLWIGLIVLAVVVVVAFLIASRLTSSLSRLAEAADEIAGGKLDTVIPQTGAAGEIGNLESSVRAMTVNLRTMINDSLDQTARTDAMFNATADGLVTISESGEILSFNTAAERLFGYSREEVVGRNVSMLAPSPHREQHDHYLSRYLQTGEAHIIGHDRELDAVRKDGSTFPMSLRVSELVRDGEHLFIGLIRDITDRKTAERSRAELFGTIREAVQRLATASHQILATTSEQAAGTQEHAAAVSQVVATADEIAQSASQAAQRADEVAQSARHTDEVGNAGLSAVEESAAAMEKVQEQVESIAERMVSLAERAQAIGEITATVSEIAEQTNVLALNAAVEAARAGEHGKGFAVVAAEVKALASESKRATAQVRSILTEVQQATTAAVLSTEQGTKTVGEANEVIEKAGETIHELAATLAQSAQTASQISTSANQQAAAVEQLNHGIRNVDTVSKQSVESIKQIERAAQNLAGLSSQLASLTEQ